MSSFCLLLILWNVSCTSTTRVTGTYSTTEHTGNIITKAYWKVRVRGEPTLIYGEQLTLNENGTFNYNASTESFSWKHNGTWQL